MRKEERLRLASAASLGLLIWLQEPAFAQQVDLVCVSERSGAAHDLSINYSNRTVTDNLMSGTRNTYQANISDNLVSWRMPNPPFLFELNRYTGKLVALGSVTTEFNCEQRSKMPKRF